MPLQSIPVPGKTSLYISPERMSMHTHPTLEPNPHPSLVIPLTHTPPQLPGHVDEVGHDVVLVTPVYLSETRSKRQLRR